MSPLLWLALTFASAPGDLVTGKELPSIDALEKRVLDQRRSIKNGHFEIRSKIWSSKNTKERRLQFVRDYEIWFDDAREARRSDERAPNPPGPDPKVSPSLKLTLKTKDFSINFLHTENRPPAGLTIAPPFVDAKVPDPRFIGMVMSTFANTQNYKLDTVVGGPGRANLELVRDRYDNVDCLRISFENRNGGKCSYWVDPQRDGVVRKIQAEIGAVKLSTETWYEQVGKTGIWFPKKCMHLHLNGDVIEREEELDVKAVALNTDLDARIFTVDGLPLPPGTKILGGPKRKP